MANDYLKFSEILTHLTELEEAWLKEQLQPISVFGNEKFVQEDIPDRLAKTMPDWTGARFLFEDLPFDPDWSTLSFEYEFQDDDEGNGRVLWFYSQGDGSVENVAWLVHRFLAKFRPDQYWMLGYSLTCSKLRVGRFHGGALFVTASAIKGDSASAFLVEQREAFEASTKGTSE